MCILHHTRRAVRSSACVRGNVKNMSNFDAARVQKELVEIERDTASGVSVEIQGSNMAHLVGSIKGN